MRSSQDGCCLFVCLFVCFFLCYRIYCCHWSSSAQMISTAPLDNVSDWNCYCIIITYHDNIFIREFTLSCFFRFFLEAMRKIWYRANEYTRYVLYMLELRGTKPKTKIQRIGKIRILRRIYWKHTLNKNNPVPYIALLHLPENQHFKTFFSFDLLET